LPISSPATIVPAERTELDLMHRIFLGLAVADGGLLVSCYALGLAGFADVRWLGSVATVATLVVHATAVGFVARSVARVETMARAGGMPDWVVAQAWKQRRKVSRFALLGSIAVVTAGVVAAIPAVGGWGLAAASVALTFNLGVLGLESLLLMIAGRLESAVGMRGHQGRSAVSMPAPPAAGVRS
jgi:hypothetical protein